MARRVALAIVLLVAAASLGACSGSVASKAPSAPASGSTATAAAGTNVGRSRYIAEGDAICMQIAEVPEAIGKPTDDSNAAIANYFKALLEATRPKVEQFGTLAPPAEDQAVADELNALFGELLAKTSDSIAALRADSPDVVRAADEARVRLEEKLSRTAKDYGFKVCGA